jgi:UDP-N-acetylglucosamine diphosphorylase/glucosamine-1-phosphate N-acetyltransferase
MQLKQSNYTIASITLFDDDGWEDLLPLTLSRSCADIRFGILTIKEKWETICNDKVYVQTKPYLQDIYGEFKSELFVNSRLLPEPKLLEVISNLKEGESVYCGETLLLCFGQKEQSKIEWEGDLDILNYPWEIFSKNHRQIENDFHRICHNRTSQKLSETNTVIGKHPIFVEEGAVVECSIFNTNEGPIYIGKNAEVQEGCMVRGPFSLGESSHLKMGAKIYTGTTIGPHCKVGGEINNSVIFGYSNKAHDGFLGNSVIGEWCNLGADTNNSNLKNNYEEVKVWSYKHKKFVKTGLQFCGLIMGDHSKSGINTMFNTGTVVGFSCNIFGSGFPRNYIPSFTWGGAASMEEYTLPKAIQTAEKVFERRNKAFDSVQNKLFTEIHSNKN